MNNLKRNIGFLPAFSTVIGIVIGSGVFLKLQLYIKLQEMLVWV